MVVEHALLRIREGQSPAFESAMIIAKPLISASPGFLGMEIRPAIGQTGTYLLLVQWETIAHHRDVFRTSDRYAKWRDALHNFYDPMPEVAYFGASL